MPSVSECSQHNSHKYRSDNLLKQGVSHANVIRSAQVNQNVNVNRNVDVDNHNDYHPLVMAKQAITTAAMTSAVTGSITHWLSPSCSAVVVSGITYRQCSSTWYQPQYAGTQVSYVAVNPPQ